MTAKRIGDSNKLIFAEKLKGLIYWTLDEEDIDTQLSIYKTENMCMFIPSDERRFNLIIMENSEVYCWLDKWGCNGTIVTGTFWEHFRKIKKNTAIHSLTSPHLWANDKLPNILKSYLTAFFKSVHEEKCKVLSLKKSRDRMLEYVSLLPRQK